jgi:hypothetical protein
MIVGTTVGFPDDAGKHQDKNKTSCNGRKFMVKREGVAGNYSNVVECETCGCELLAYENGISGPAPYSASA